MARKDAGPEPTWTYLRRVSETSLAIHVLDRGIDFMGRQWVEPHFSIYSGGAFAGLRSKKVRFDPDFRYLFTYGRREQGFEPVRKCHSF